MQAAACFAAIVGLHFSGMVARSPPWRDIRKAPDSEAFAAMAAAIGMVACDVGTGIPPIWWNAAQPPSENRIAHIAMHDALTNLANRHQFTEALRNECNALGDGGARLRC